MTTDSLPMPDDQDSAPASDEAAGAAPAAEADAPKRAPRRRKVDVDAAEAVAAVEAPVAQPVADVQADGAAPARKRAPRRKAVEDVAAQAVASSDEQGVSAWPAESVPAPAVAPTVAFEAEATGDASGEAQSAGEGGSGGREDRESRGGRGDRRERRRNRGPRPEGEAQLSVDGASESADESAAFAEGEDDGTELRLNRRSAMAEQQASEVFAELLSGEFDKAHEEESEGEDAEASGPYKRVLRPEPDAPKLQKVLAQPGVGSRRDIEKMIEEGRIEVNDQVAHIGQRISHGDRVKVAGKPIKVRIAPPAARILAYHKPVGEVVTHDDPQGRPTVFRRLPRLQSGKWMSVGRLDLNTEGLLLFTRVREQQQAFGVEVQATHRHPLAALQARQATEHRRAALRVVVGDDLTHGLVISQDAGRWRCDANLDGLARHLDAVAMRNALADVGDLVIDLDAPLFDHFLDVATRTHTRLGQHLLQLGRIGLGAQHALVRTGSLGIFAFGFFFMRLVELTRQQLGEHLAGLLLGHGRTAIEAQLSAVVFAFGEGCRLIGRLARPINPPFGLALGARAAIATALAAIATTTSALAVFTPAGATFAGALGFARRITGRFGFESNGRRNSGRGHRLGRQGRDTLLIRRCNRLRCHILDRLATRCAFARRRSAIGLHVSHRLGNRGFNGGHGLGRVHVHLAAPRGTLGRIGFGCRRSAGRLVGGRCAVLIVRHGQGIGGHGEGESGSGSSGGADTGSPGASGAVEMSLASGACGASRASRASGAASAWAKGSETGSATDSPAASATGSCASSPGSSAWPTGSPSRVGNCDREDRPMSSRNWRVVANKAGRPGASRGPMTSTQPRSSSCLTMCELTVTPRMSSMSPRVTGCL